MQNTITRRAVLSSGAAAALVAPPTASASPSPVSAELADLIASYRVARDAWEATVDPLEAAQNAWDEQLAAMPTQMVPCLVAPVHFDTAMGHEQMHREIAAKFAEQRKSVEAFKRMDPLLAEAMTATLRTKEAQNLALADEAFDKLDQQMAHSGLPQAEENYATTDDAFNAALARLLEYQAVTLGEERSRAAAIVESNVGREMVLMAGNYSEAFLYAVAGISNFYAEG